jgi:hypothetical protein
VRQHVVVELAVEAHGPELGAADKPLSVVRDTAVARQGGERLRREVGLHERRDVDPAGVPDVRHVGGGPGIAGCPNLRPSLLALVGELERRGVLRVERRHGHPERRERRHDERPVLRRALREDPPAPLKQAKAVTAMKRTAADGRPAAVDDVDRHVAEDSELAHARILSVQPKNVR